MTNKSCATPRANSGSTNVALDTSGLSAALKQMAEAQMAEQMQKLKEQAKAMAINPVATIAEVSERMSALYSRYEKLQEIGKILNGVGLSEPIPEDLSIEDIAITFRTKDANSETGYSDYKTASVKNVICAGDIYKLLSGEMGVLISSGKPPIRTGRSVRLFQPKRVKIHDHRV
ncbi:hypothetical protein EBZ39_04520 [bacterium]|nr:hypothetical protein [bacterium]